MHKERDGERVVALKAFPTPLASPHPHLQLLLLTSDVFGSFDVEEDRLHVFHTHALWRSGERTKKNARRADRGEVDKRKRDEQKMSWLSTHSRIMGQAAPANVALRCAALTDHHLQRAWPVGEYS